MKNSLPSKSVNFKLVIIRVFLVTFLAVVSSRAAVLLQEDFEAATPGVGNWHAYNGWTAFGGVNFVDEVVDYSGAGLTQRGELGFYAPSFGTTMETLQHSVASSTVTTLGFSLDFFYVPSTNGFDDTFAFGFHNSTGALLASIEIIPEFGVIGLSDGGGGFLTNVNPITDSTLIGVSGTIDLATNTWTVLVDGSEIATDITFNGSGAALDLSIFSTQWIIDSVFIPGNNFISVDNISIWEVPEPSTAFLFVLGLLSFITQRRRSDVSSSG